MRNAIVIELKLEGATWAEVTEVDGRTERQLRRVWDQWRAQPRQVELLNRRPMENLEALIRRLRLSWRLFAHEAAHAEQDTARIAAVRGMMQADAQLTEVLMAVGHLPENLSLAASEDALRELARTMANVMHDVMEGKMSLEEAQGVFDGIVHPGKREQERRELPA